MPEIGPIHPLSYRQELTTPLFQKIRAGESCSIIGAASMGKSRLLQFLLRPDVVEHHLPLGDDAASLPPLWIDCNRMAEFTAWGLHELILTALVESSGEHPATSPLRDNLTEWRKEAITTQNGLLAQRYVELALQVFCKEQGLHLCFILDEFDEAYANLPPQALASLRALRDRHKYQVSYLLFTRDHPKYLRDPAECEGFYELVSRSVMGLQPYNEADARRVIEQIVARREHELPGFDEAAKAQVLHLSGRHPGLLVALIDAVITKPPYGITWEQWGAEQPKAWEECRKIWRGLRREERDALIQLAANRQPVDADCESLLLKGLAVEGNRKELPRLFSPLFQRYVQTETLSDAATLKVDTASGTVLIGGRQTETLTPKEYELIAYLYARRGEVCETEGMIEQLYPGEEGYNITDNNIAALVGRVRKKVEPNPNRPQYLLNVRGRGYKLIDEPQ